MWEEFNEWIKNTNPGGNLLFGHQWCIPVRGCSPCSGRVQACCALERVVPPTGGLSEQIALSLLHLRLRNNFSKSFSSYAEQGQDDNSGGH